ncbi:MAG: winged helix-turn-helix domain-containing protein [Pseudomonadota bacterium]|nr:winged helix-turn-helix domain-containing protein [Pseudomonadota bacterium]
MKAGPDISRVASLIGDPARANILAELIDGRALTASELALVAGVSKQTASAHLSKLLDGGLLEAEAQGRHRYFRLSGEEVAEALESLMGVAALYGAPRTRTGPKEEALRRARVCYDHLAGEIAVAAFDKLIADNRLSSRGGELILTRKGRGWFSSLGIDVSALETQRRALCRPCLDWSMRRRHLAGGLGSALLETILKRKWARRTQGSREVRFSPAGEMALFAALG